MYKWRVGVLHTTFHQKPPLNTVLEPKHSKTRGALFYRQPHVYIHVDPCLVRVSAHSYVRVRLHMVCV